MPERNTATDNPSPNVANLILYVRDQLSIEKIAGIITTGGQPSFINVLKEMIPAEREILRAFLEGRLNKSGYFSFNSAAKGYVTWGSMAGYAALVISPYLAAAYAASASVLFVLNQYSHQKIIKERADAILKELDSNFPDEIPNRSAENVTSNNNNAGSRWNIFSWYQPKAASDNQTSGAEMTNPIAHASADVTTTQSHTDDMKMQIYRQLGKRN